MSRRHPAPTVRRPRDLAAWAAWVQGAALVGLVGLLVGRLAGRRTATASMALTAATIAPYARVVARHRPYAGDPHAVRHWVVDTTWSAPNTLAGALFCGHQRLRRNPERPERSAGSGSIWLSRPAISGFATTVGIVKAGSHDRVDAHEDVHVHQARLLGPLYLPLVVVDYVLATVLPFWLLERRRRGEPWPRTVREYFLAGVYREVWHERWAYAAASGGSLSAR